MRKTGLGVLIALGLVVALMTAASELGGEVVTLATRDAQGAVSETSLWIVEDEGALWLRAGNPDSAWLKRLRDNPEVEVARGETRARYLAEVVRGRSEQVNAKMAQAYGWADRVISLMRDDADTVAIRLDPVAR